MTAPAAHTLRCEAKDEPREFRAVCSCGWRSVWRSTNACMGNGRRHVAATRRKTPPREITDRVASTEVKIPRRRLVEAGDELTIAGIRGRCSFVRYVRHESGAEWLDVTTSRGFSRTVRPEAVKTVHRRKGRKTA